MGKKKAEAVMVICPECESDLDIEEDEVDEGEVVSCTECGSDFEVVAIEPLELTRIADEDDEEEEAEEKEDEDGY
jgi:alpha-aminoadipate carrier protein LysW